MDFNKLEYACNPYLPGKEHIPDGEPHIFGNRLYVFGSHDEIGSNEYCTGSYVGWSADVNNLSEWKYEGEIYSKGQDPLDPEGNKNYYAPDVVMGNDGKYYLYYSICNSYVISVARADRPEGPYHFWGHVKDKNGHVIGSSEGDYYQFDPAVINDNGRIWLYSGQGIPMNEIDKRKVMGSMVCELSDDMLTLKSEQHQITANDFNRFDENPFFEASSIRKYGETYYFIYSPLPNTHNLCYATSNRPDGDFKYKGVLVSNADIFEGIDERQIPLNYWGNNHGSLLELHGEYYIFYHKNTSRCAFARQGCLEHIVMDENREFKQAELTSLGFAKTSFPANGRYAAYTACLLQRKDMKPFQPYTFYEYSEADPYVNEDETNIPYIANLTDGAMFGFRYFSFDTPKKKVRIIARTEGQGELEIICNGESAGNVCFTGTDMDSANSFESASWNYYSGDCISQTETAEVRFVFHGPGKADVLYVEFS